LTLHRLAGAVGPLAAASLLVGVAVAATTVVPSSRTGRNLQAVSANSLKPAFCAALNLNGMLTGSGIFSDSYQPHLVVGSAGVDSISGMGGNDCILGGGGNDALRGDGGIDVCIGGPGTDSFNLSCEVRIQ
jgi:Ca2+-binding RTX toxin-like protein